MQDNSCPYCESKDTYLYGIVENNIGEYKCTRCSNFFKVNIEISLGMNDKNKKNKKGFGKKGGK